MGGQSAQGAHSVFIFLPDEGKICRSLEQKIKAKAGFIERKLESVRDGILIW